MMIDDEPTEPTDEPPEPTDEPTEPEPEPEPPVVYANAGAAEGKAGP